MRLYRPSAHDITEGIVVGIILVIVALCADWLAKHVHVITSLGDLAIPAASVIVGFVLAVIIAITGHHRYATEAFVLGIAYAITAYVTEKVKI